MSTDYARQWSLPVTQAFLDDIPLPLSIFRPDGLLIGANHASEAFWGVSRATSLGKFNALDSAQANEKHLRETFAQVIQGEHVTSKPTRYDTTRMGVAYDKARIIWAVTTFCPMRDQDGHTSYVMALVNDVTAQMEQTQIIDAARQEIEQQRETIRMLATPVAQVWEGILTVPIQGALDAERAMAMTENLLEAIVAHQAEQVILDITGVPVVDTQVANYLLTAAHACHLLGSEVALVGISSSIAQTIVHLGVDLSGIITHTNLQAGIAWALKRQGLVVQHHTALRCLSPAPIGSAAVDTEPTRRGSRDQQRRRHQ